MRGAERDLLGLGEEVVGIAVQDHPSDGRERHELLGHDFRGIEHVEAEPVGFALRKHLHCELPFGIRAGLDRFPEVAAVEVGVRARDLHGFIPRERVSARGRRPVKLHESRLAV